MIGDMILIKSKMPVKKQSLRVLFLRTEDKGNIKEKMKGADFMGFVIAVAAIIGLALLVYLFCVLFRGEKL